MSTATLRKTWFDRRINFILLANGWIRQLSLKVANLKFGILYRSIVHFKMEIKLIYPRCFGSQIMQRPFTLFYFKDMRNVQS